jgi:multiple sugar transport system substrate-binding protein
MSARKSGKITRRDLVAGAGAALAAAALPGVACSRAPEKPSAARKTLKILQWSHFIPAFDAWFDGVYTKEWGAKNGTEVIVDHMASTEVNARAAAEAAAGRGHDLFLFQWPPAAYENRVLDLSDVAAEVAKKHGAPISLAERSTFNPKSKKRYAFSDSYVPDPGNYRIDLWGDAGFPEGPSSWEDLRVGGRRIKEKTGNPVGVGLSQEIDSNMALRGLLWSFGASEQDAEGNVVFDSKETVEALKFGRALYKEAMTPEVFTWEPASNNRMMLAGRASFVVNAISVTRTAERENPEIARKIGLTKPLAGPVRRIAAEHVMNCYVVWSFAENPDGAKKFLVDMADDLPVIFEKSECYNLPCYPTAIPDLAKRLADDPKGEPKGKYAVLADAVEWSTNIGYPGYANAATDQIFNTYVIPTAFARVARDEATPEEAAKSAAAEIRRIFERWR